MLLVNFMRQTATKSCLRTVEPLYFAKFEKLYPVIFLVKYTKFFIINKCKITNFAHYSIAKFA